MTSFQIASDLHIEYNSDQNPNAMDLITPVADVLILAGDIGSIYKREQLTSFLQQICPHFKAVLYIPGNNEYYMVNGIQPMDFDKLKSILREIERSIPNLHVLDKNSVQIGDLCIAGCTLWSDVTCKLPKFIVRIHNMFTGLYKEKFDQDRIYIENMIKYCKNNKMKLMIITHHPPTYKTLEGCKKRDKFKSLYASNLDYLMEHNSITAWICGHVHKNFNFNINGCRVIGNQKGKPKDNIDDYNKQFTISL